MDLLLFESVLRKRNRGRDCGGMLKRHGPITQALFYSRCNSVGNTAGCILLYPGETATNGERQKRRRQNDDHRQLLSCYRR